MFRFVLKPSSLRVKSLQTVRLSSTLSPSKKIGSCQFSTSARELFKATDLFSHRHLGSSDTEIQSMLESIGYSSLEEMTKNIIPSSIRLPHSVKLDGGETRSETELLGELKKILSQNEVKKSFIGMGYHNTHTPKIILRNILENPAWYTAYTPYQAEISQGRLEALLNFQTMVSELTGLKFSNASLLDEGTAAAEAMFMCTNSYTKPKTLRTNNKPEHTYFVSERCHPNTIEVVKTRAEAFGFEVHVGDHQTFDFDNIPVCGALIQYPCSDGQILSYQNFAEKVHSFGGHVVCATDLLSLTLLKPPGEFGCDIAIGNSQRFGVPLGFGGPHAAFISVKDSNLQRKMPGRIIGVSKDTRDKPALRLTLQTREQHIRRDKATSNICTAQALLAVMSSCYAIYHGPGGLKNIASRTHGIAAYLESLLKKLGFSNENTLYFDTLRYKVPNPDVILTEAQSLGYNLRKFDDNSVVISLDETVSLIDITNLVQAFSNSRDSNNVKKKVSVEDLNLDLHLSSLPITPGVPDAPSSDGTISSKSLKLKFDCLLSDDENCIGSEFVRKSEFLTHQVFNSYHTEHEFLRYINRLVNKDYSLIHGMIPLGSCTMKLNATSEMIPITWPEVSNIHPFSPESQLKGYQQLISSLEDDLCKITGFDAVSLQPNAGSQGEYAGLLSVKKYFKSKGEEHRNICLIPSSAHGTNPASASMVGFKVVVINCHENGYINTDHLNELVTKHNSNIAAIMITYPSTFGVFEENIKEICQLIHSVGAQVYMDGANMNAQVGLTSPGHIGADVCHLNLHKTFCIPHGGGGPGIGPVCVRSHLIPFLPSKPLNINNLESISNTNSSINSEQFLSNQTTSTSSSTLSHRSGPVASSPYGSASILPISWMYIHLMGEKDLTKSTQLAILNANYMKSRLENHYLIKFISHKKRVAHEFVIDLRPFKKTANIEAEDVAKRLIDYGFHAPTMSWPVPGTLMIEPTESESKFELDRFCDAMISIRQEIKEIEDGILKPEESPLWNSPHTIDMISSDNWDRKYSREKAVYPTKDSKRFKFWPSVGRVDNTWGDRNIMCSCPPIEDYQS